MSAGKIGLPVDGHDGRHADADLMPTWYVTFEVRRRGLLPKPRSPRETKMFATEVEAKVFARLKLDEGLIVFAGTINPHSPRQVIPSNRIQLWLSDGAVPPPADGDEE